MRKKVEERKKNKKKPQDASATHGGHNSDQFTTKCKGDKVIYKLECGPMPNVMAAVPNIGGALCLMPLSLADAHYYSALQ